MKPRGSGGCGRSCEGHKLHGAGLWKGWDKRDLETVGGATGEVLTLLLLDVHQLGDEVLQLGHPVVHGGLQRLHPSLLGSGSRRVHVAHVLDGLGVITGRAKLCWVRG